MKPKIICFYKNTTSQIQIVRLFQQFELIMFPGEQLLFETIPDVELKIESEVIAGKVATNQVSCLNLQILE
ncbi:DUF1830 domain-containing protein [Nostoc sp. FACHB-110]|uniref:DUF1830 domain-containing protein n=1 Tax=Nostoc sp. FACHB-110 TaxID=2692834 RepID=UPI00168700F8|nr:DUF1830 domain-containing protein [Nostoc sp. FACHB-110]MBD2435248.1 DUF1830 domain-containing protein [Nostoc sp. FACHB-110]